ncbi:glycoside hydrolase family 43 protein [Goodfellowiella coeruleoviolacea]|uniref:Glycosyl hydrolases family 43 n=1 Tax=Goodfellowiella coeruleoviolacea TaxID=334858 RepID=A0AAE3GDB2_9PSEU|nr:glycoside hydrolase family 43 protein [Goodfellowiella coeruleoviolacea]MCP2164053.1 Glycosyl hydrolases family 43 [Goodfellowiella coeruleoviolacea]
MNLSSFPRRSLAHAALVLLVALAGVVTPTRSAPARSAPARSAPAQSAPVHAAAPPAGSTSRYTMTAFTNSSESNMYVYEAPDATGFRLRRGPAYTPPSGLIRDPSIIRHTDGYYYIVYTTNWTGNTIGFARSSDRLSWTFLRNHTIPLSGVANTWAPEWFVDTDGSVNVIVSLSTTGSDFKPYKLTATNAALSAWTAPTVLSGIGPNYIDTFIVKVNGTYHAFTKQETTKYIEYATAASLTGPYTFQRTGDWAGWGGPREGQSLVRLDNGGWRIYFDGYTVGKYFFSDSVDGFRTWTPPAELPALSGFARHFTVLKETVSGGASLPTATTRSLRSTNYPDRYLRHRDNLGYLEQVSASSSAQTKQDATFTVTPGLADANCYSLRAANGQYLRHYDFRIQLGADDGGSTFRQDATFCAHTGASSGSLTLESYNYPGRYLRHYDFALRVDLYQDTDTFRADSSFVATTPWA